MNHAYHLFINLLCRLIPTFYFASNIVCELTTCTKIDKISAEGDNMHKLPLQYNYDDIDILLVRYYGFYSNKFKDKVTNKSLFTDAQLKKMLDNTYWTNALKNSFGYDPTFCKCGHQMILDYSNSYFPTRGNST